MAHPPKAPGETEIYGTFSRHLGPRFSGAGLGIQFHYNQQPGIHFKVEPSPEYRQAIVSGLTDAMAACFPEFPPTGSIWITRVDDHPVDSSQDAFYRAAWMVVEQAASIVRPLAGGA